MRLTWGGGQGYATELVVKKLIEAEWCQAW